MSKIKVNRIENTSTTDGGVSIDVDGHVTIDGQQLPTAGPLSNRSLIINGAMKVSQRGTSITGATDIAYRACDRFENIIQSAGTYTVSQATDAPSGFTKSFKYEVTTAQPSPSAGAQCALQYTFEGQDLQLLDYGTSSAKSMTLSFWVKSNLPGTYSAEFFQDDNSLRNYIFSYEISSAGVWEPKTVTITGDTAGVIDDDNTAGLTLKMYQAAGPDFTSGTFSPGSWAARTKANVVSSSSPNLAATVGNTWQITGVQLEVGSKATPFEHRSYGDELARCQRYYQKLTYEGNDVRVGIGQAINSSSVDVYIPFVTTMRASPTALEQSGTAADYGIINASGGGGDCTSIPSFRFANLSSITVRFTDTGQVSAGNASQAYLDTANAFLAWSAEL